MKHKHADAIHSYAEGAAIQYSDDPGKGWMDIKSPTFCECYHYRVKPEPKPDVVLWAKAGKYEPASQYAHLGCAYSTLARGEAKLKLTYDGETLELKSAEVIS